MKREWFEEVVQKLTPSIDWTKQELEGLASHLMEICELYDGRVFQDEDVAELLEKEYCTGRVVRICDHLARLYARSLLATVDPPVRAEDTATFDVALPFLAPKRLVLCIDLNEATEDELEGLQGIGRVTAKRIIERRTEMRGRFTSIDDLKGIEGIGPMQIEQFRDAVYIGKGGRVPVLYSASLEEFRRRPNFANYVAVLVETGVSLSSFHRGTVRPVKELFATEVLGVKEHLARRRYNQYAPLPGISGRTLNEVGLRRALASDVENHAIQGTMHGALIEDSQYPDFVMKLLAEARNKVRIVMFFIRTKDGSYPTDALFGELDAAHLRDVDVKVILDRDAEGDGINSRIINEEAHARLTKIGIPVLYDSVDRYTHSKIVLVDDAHVVLGSHNWTAGSFFQYDDTSVYIHSPNLAKHYHAQFDRLWDEYSLM